MRFRENEWFNANLGGARKHHDQRRNHPKGSHCVLPLWGCFKGEEGKRHHFLVMVEVTASGLEPRKWLDRIVARQKAQGLIWGPLFVDHEGRKVESELCNGIIIEVLKDCQA